MELCVKCFFDNKSDFDKALAYLKPIVGGDMCVSGQDVEVRDMGLYIETYRCLTQAQLDRLTALCPIRPKREITKQRVYSKMAFLIGRFGAAYHPEDDLRELAPEDSTYDDIVQLELAQNDIDYMCDKLGLDPCAIALDLMTEFGITPEHLKD